LNRERDGKRQLELLIRNMTKFCRTPRCVTAIRTTATFMRSIRFIVLEVEEMLKRVQVVRIAADVGLTS
jgi:hypothetical protein